MTKLAGELSFGLRASSFLRPSSFVLRHFRTDHLAGFPPHDRQNGVRGNDAFQLMPFLGAESALRIPIGELVKAGGVFWRAFEGCDGVEQLFSQVLCKRTQHPAKNRRFE